MENSCTCAKFWLHVEEQKLSVKAQIPCFAGEAQLRLNREAVVRSMDLNGHDDFRAFVDPQSEYRKIYVLDSAEAGILRISYITPVSGWDNVISDKLIAISIYSQAFPARLPEHITESICYFDGSFEGYDIYGAFLDAQTGLYAKRSKKMFGEIANVIAIRREEKREYIDGAFHVIYPKGCDCSSVYESIEIGKKAFAFYSSIYPARELGGFDVVVLGNGDQGGAYNRENLIVMGEPPAVAPTEKWVKIRKYQLFAHELGHIWFNSADSFSFEDWLNETGAEWSQLLFLLEIGEEELFQDLIELHYRNHREWGEEIRPADRHHPSAVHDSGVVLLHMVYQKFGRNAVQELLKILSRMEKPNTEDFVAAVRREYSEETASFLEERLDEKIKI